MHEMRGTEAPLRHTRLVLDTNLFVAAFWHPQGASSRILAACAQREFVLLVSPVIRQEVLSALRRARTSRTYQAHVEVLLRDAEEVYPRRSVHLVANDPDDDKFLECALEGGADYLLTHDAHLLRLGTIDRVLIWRPAQFARMYL